MNTDVLRKALVSLALPVLLALTVSACGFPDLAHAKTPVEDPPPVVPQPSPGAGFTPYQTSDWLGFSLVALADFADMDSSYAMVSHEMQVYRTTPGVGAPVPCPAKKMKCRPVGSGAKASRQARGTPSSQGFLTRGTLRPWTTHCSAVLNWWRSQPLSGPSQERGAKAGGACLSVLGSPTRSRIAM